MSDVAKEFRNFAELPESVKVLICSNLSLRELCASACTCKELRQICKPISVRLYCCKGCGHRICHPKDIVRSPTNIELQDGSIMVLSQPLGKLNKNYWMWLGEEFNSMDGDLRNSVRTSCGLPTTTMLPTCQFRAQVCYCPGCKLTLGLLLVAIYEMKNGDTDGSFIHRREYVLPECGKFLLCESYLELRGPDLTVSTDESPYVCCSGTRAVRPDGAKGSKEACNNPLFRVTARLNWHHVWDAGSGSERACLVNSVAPGAVVELNRRTENLAQGMMEVADVQCSRCQGSLGWRFCSDLAPHYANEHLVGRYGFVRSSQGRQVSTCCKLLPADEPHSPKKE
eukprot:CAMPEP_0202907394 /NCGR_PEP_ID=MMETSP1392-20130828/42323_1 /ASSEMBLY_ACC=CAM_ASM_000868 /TAXON_ID=225041 /ORGANISM="Chlamydomonas chlamydogama, Strain SAG 11-48b" /LENGTH=339 /DNA_ID=CAMNT_0049596249 /DNA_START=1 /DNA_END=1020 /DNA_ORIENTATION=+